MPLEISLFMPWSRSLLDAAWHQDWEVFLVHVSFHPG